MCFSYETFNHFFIYSCVAFSFLFIFVFSVCCIIIFFFPLVFRFRLWFCTLAYRIYTYGINIFQSQNFFFFFRARRRWRDNTTKFRFKERRLDTHYRRAETAIWNCCRVRRVRIFFHTSSSVGVVLFYETARIEFKKMSGKNYLCIHTCTRRENVTLYAERVLCCSVCIVYRSFATFARDDFVFFRFRREKNILKPRQTRCMRLFFARVSLSSRFPVAHQFGCE